MADDTVDSDVPHDSHVVSIKGEASSDIHKQMNLKNEVKSTGLVLPQKQPGNLLCDSAQVKQEFERL